MVPFFPNVRKGELSKLQRKYIGLFAPYLKRFNIVRRDFLADMSKEKYRMYYEFNKELYGFNGFSRPVSQKGKNLIGLFLKKTKKQTKASLRRIDFPESFNMFINSMHIPKTFLRKNLKKIAELYGDIDFYSLESPSLKESVKLIESNFKF